ncbi:Uncharacterised protein [Serratia ficaria]|uniref:hypothetical protein n=1 Tax=Serratia ficaria TaxID=61651 RepID=UPI0021837FCC|nr:hypothetical protein [Serratia ficaria]CAI2531471.1 Uncharacterised protein [Serratia ficaria]
MNIEALKEKTLTLRAAIDALKASDPAVEKLSVELELLMTRAERGQIHTPMEWRDIPGRYHFTEEGLQQYAELEHAFAEFRIELIGGESPTLRKLKEKMGERPKSEPKSGRLT